VEQIDKPFQFSFDYSREKYHEWDDKVPSHWISPPLPAMGGELAPGVKEKKPADDPELGSLGETDYHASMQLPEGWMMVQPKDVDLQEDWLEYHAKYSFKDGVFTAERRLIVKKKTLPLEEWENYLLVRRCMFTDWIYQSSIGPPNLIAPQIVQSSGIGMIVPLLLRRDIIEDLDSNKVQQIVAAMAPLLDAMSILEADAADAWDGPEKIAKAVDLSRKAVESAEAISQTYTPDDTHSLYWAQILSTAWSIRGWAALEAHDLPTSENYLRAAWALAQDSITGYQLGKLLEAKGDKDGAAHQYLLARHTKSSYMISGGEKFIYDQIGENYHRLTGNDAETVAASMAKSNASESPVLQLSKKTEFRQITRSSKLTGAALYILAFEPGKPVQVRFLSGDKGFQNLENVFKSVPFHPLFPVGSKARILREIRMICTPYAGCDGYLILPSSVEMPAHQITLPKAPDVSRTIQIEVRPTKQ
jgi:hypothetical protein